MDVYLKRSLLTASKILARKKQASASAWTYVGAMRIALDSSAAFLEYEMGSVEGGGKGTERLLEIGKYGRTKHQDHGTRYDLHHQHTKLTLNGDKEGNRCLAHEEATASKAEMEL